MITLNQLIQSQRCKANGQDKKTLKPGTNYLGNPFWTGEIPKAVQAFKIRQFDPN